MNDAPNNIVVPQERNSWFDDDEGRELFWELTSPIEEVFLDEFQRYLDLFFTYWKKTPFHARLQYGRGFLRQKGKKKDGQEFDRGCYDALIAQMLDYERWKGLHPDKRHTEAYWIALYGGARSSLKAVDIDNKENLFGYYRRGFHGDGPMRPLVTLTLDHLKNVKRIYDAFPNHIWCVSSGTLGLHAWEKLPGPQPIHLIQSINKTTLNNIGLGKTEVHPMPGRPFRRPFGQDYYTITNDGMIEDWWRQLDYFENVAETPTFDAIYQALRELVRGQWCDFGYRRLAEQTVGHLHLKKYEKGKKVNIHRLEEDLKLLDAWAERGFPNEMPVRVAMTNDPPAAAGDNKNKNDTAGAIINPPSPGPVGQERACPHPASPNRAPDCDIDMHAVCDGQWVQHCENWAINGLPCHDSLFVVCSQLARWLYFIELHHLPKDDRLERVIKIITTYCSNKNNGYISRLDAGLVHEVDGHVRRAVSFAMVHAKDLFLFTRIRQKRERGEYRRVIFLEHHLLAKGQWEGQEDTEREEEDNTLLSPRCASLCCTLFEDNKSTQRRDEPERECPEQGVEDDNKNETTLHCDIFDGEEWTIPLAPAAPRLGPTAKERRKSAAEWDYKPDDTPLPEKLLAVIQAHYAKEKKRLTKPTLKKLTRFINLLYHHGGEGRLSIEALKKMGFGNDRARGHLVMLEGAKVIWRGGYCPAEGIGRKFTLRKRTINMMPSPKAKEKSA